MELYDQMNELIEKANPEVKNIVQELLKIEEKYLPMRVPKGIHDDIVDMIIREVQ